MKPFFITCMALFFNVFPVSAQVKYVRIAGRVQDVGNGNPLTGASVLLETTKTGVKTDVDGNFFISLEVGSTYNLVISNVGYQSKVIEGLRPVAGENQPLHVGLEQARASLENVIIRSSSRRNLLLLYMRCKRTVPPFQMPFQLNPLKNRPTAIRAKCSAGSAVLPYRTTSLSLSAD